MVYTRTVKATASPAASVAVQGRLSGVRAFPNPWRSDRHASLPVTLDHLTSDSIVKIFTVSGRWVKTLSVSGTTASWDLTNDGGENVASGVYLYVVTAAGAEKASGKITLIR